jgi:glycosyltransferase involved in cell wall biosynthesis
MSGSNAQHGGLGRPAASDAGPRRGGTLLLLTEAFRGPGGIQTYTRDLAQALLRCRPGDPLGALVLNDDARDVYRDEWRDVLAEGAGRRRLRFARRAVACAARRRPARVILGHRNLLPLTPLVRLAAPRSEVWLLAYGVEAEAPFSLVEHGLLRGVARVFAISPATAGLLAAAGYPRAVELWPCGLPFDCALPALASPRFETPLRLLAVSRLAPPERRKGLDHLLRALALLAVNGVEARLDIVGDGEDRRRLERLARELDLAPRVTFHGRVSDAELRQCYAACDVFVLPSGREGFGLVYLEAMAHARPVVAADAGGTPFVVRPGVSGELVPYGDPERLAQCLARLARDPEGARRLGLAGRRFLEQTFTFEHLVERTREILGDT